MRQTTGKKKVLSGMLAIVMALVLSCGVLTGCGGSGSSDGEDTTETEEVQPFESFVGTWEYEGGGSLSIAEDETFSLTWPTGETFAGSWEMKDDDTMTLTVEDESFPNDDNVDEVTISEDGSQLTDTYDTVLTRKV